jgi:hypothetical protein
MRRLQEFKGQSTRLDYNRERGEFVARPVPHPFVARNAASKVLSGAYRSDKQRQFARSEGDSYLLLPEANGGAS